MFDGDSIPIMDEDHRSGHNPEIISDTRNGIILLIDLLCAGGVYVSLSSTERLRLAQILSFVREETGDFDSITDTVHTSYVEKMGSQSILSIGEAHGLKNPNILFVSANVSLVSELSLCGQPKFSTCFLEAPKPEVPSEIGHDIKSANGAGDENLDARLPYTYAVSSLYELRALLTCQISATCK